MPSRRHSSLFATAVVILVVTTAARLSPVSHAAPCLHVDLGPAWADERCPPASSPSVAACCAADQEAAAVTRAAARLPGQTLCSSAPGGQRLEVGRTASGLAVSHGAAPDSQHSVPLFTLHASLLI